MTTRQTTAGAAGGNTGSSSATARWSDLPDDILGNILLKINSLRDRVRLTAICRPWRATVVGLPAPPATPLLLLSPHNKTGRTKQLCGGGLEDSWVLHVTEKAADKWFIGSHEGGWVVVFHFGTRELLLVNLFSGAEVGVCSPWHAGPSGDLRWTPISHVILSDCPTSSSGCILAAITNDYEIALCKVGCRSGWTKQSCGKKKFMDVAFCNGDLYGLVDRDEELVRFKIATEEDGSPMVTSTHKIAIKWPHGPPAHAQYIVDLHGKPTMAIMAQWFPNGEPFFKVFELVDADTSDNYQHKWEEVTSFGGYALYLGPGKSKAVHVPVGAERRGFERNHIYYSKANLSIESNLYGDEVYSLILDDGRIVYCSEDQNIGDGLGRTGYHMTGWENASMWLHPPNF